MNPRGNQVQVEITPCWASIYPVGQEEVGCEMGNKEAPLWQQPPWQCRGRAVPAHGPGGRLSLSQDLAPRGDPDKASAFPTVI